MDDCRYFHDALPDADDDDDGDNDDDDSCDLGNYNRVMVFF